MLGNSCSNIDLKTVLPVTKHLTSGKDVSVGSFSHLCQQPIPTFMKIKVTRKINKYYGIHLMDQLQTYDPFIAIPKRPMGCQYINPHNVQILKAFNFNTNVQLEMYHKFSTVHCTQANQHKKRTVKNRYILDVLL
jgi:hypothetical protein